MISPTEVAFILFVLAAFVAVGWVFIAGDRVQDMVNEEPRLDTRGPDDR